MAPTGLPTVRRRHAPETRVILEAQQLLLEVRDRRAGPREFLASRLVPGRDDAHQSFSQGRTLDKFWDVERSARFRNQAMRTAPELHCPPRIGDCVLRPEQGREAPEKNRAIGTGPPTCFSWSRISPPLDG